MSPFGPFYPAPLQTVVNHAERLSNVLAREEAARAGVPSRRAAWLVGRTGEMEQVMEALAQDLRAGRRTAGAAAEVLQEYVDSLHEGLAIRLGVRNPSCCHKGRTPPPKSTTAPTTDTVDRLLGSLDPAAAHPRER